MVEVTKLHTLTGHKEAVYALEEGLAPNKFYSSGADGFVVEWDLEQPESGHSVAKISGSVYSMRLHKEKGILIVGQNFDGIHFLDVKNKQTVGSVQCAETAIFDIQIFNNIIFVGTGDGTIVVIDYESRSIISKIKLSEKSVRSMAVLEELGVLVAAYSDHSFRVINLIDYTMEEEVLGHKNSIFAVRPSHDEKYMLTTGRDAHLKFWNIQENFNMDEAIVAHMYAINDIAFRTDGKYFATASMDKTIKIWDYNQRRLLKVIDKARHNGHLSSVNKVIWLAHQNALVSCSDDRSIGVWNVDFDK